MKTFFLTVATALSSSAAWSFPENVRHGYFSCTACHVSPSGGGVLTPYGRSLSSELMSTWGTSRTSGFAFTDNENESKNPPWFRANVFLRGVQTRRDSPTVEQARFIPMQADLEGGYDGEKFAVIGSIGLRAGSPGSADLNETFSRRHYFLYRVDDGWSVRAGKFMFAFGLNGPDHITATRRGLTWDQGRESYNLEVTRLEEKSSTVITAISDSPQDRTSNKEAGLALTENFFVREKSRVGVNAFAGETSSFKRYVLGPSWTASFTESLWLNSEIFWQSKKLKSRDENQIGYATFNRLSYEATKGVFPFLQIDRSYLNSSDASSRVDSYGGGLQWLPYPHFELLGFAGEEEAAARPRNSLAWIMLNFYL